jgi:hypothetical protein
MANFYFKTALKAYSTNNANWHTCRSPHLDWNATALIFTPDNGDTKRTITVASDSVYIDDMNTPAGPFTTDTLAAALQTVFPNANSGNGGSGISTLTLTPVSTSQINASWTAVTGATGYTLERSTASNFSSPTTVYTGTATSFNDTGLSADTQYYYRVKAAVNTTSTAKNATTQTQIVWADTVTWSDTNTWVD